MRKRIALINQRYGLEINGGSEYYTRLIAERLIDAYDVDVITTKALEYTTWENYYTNDEEIINGVRVLRFTVDKNRDNDFEDFCVSYMECLNSHELDIEKENIWFDKQGPVSSGAIKYIKDNKDKYDVFIFVTYLYYLTVLGLPEVCNKSIFIPTAHEEPYIHFKTFEKLFKLPKAYVFLTDEERDLVCNLFKVQDYPQATMGVGVEYNGKIEAQAFREKYKIDGDYIIYTGRIDEGKNCHVMFDYFIEYKKRHPENKVKLVLMGKKVCDIPKHNDIIPLGFVSEEDKFNGVSGAKFLILPSKFESLSISVLEAMTLSVPVVVNGVCDVLKGHCTKSNGGLYYMNYFEFEGIVEYIFSHPNEYNIMRQNALNYVNNYFSWDVIMKKFRQLIEQVTD